MGLEFWQETSVSPGVHLTPSLSQSISILSMSAMELSDYVRGCVESNPFFDPDSAEMASSGEDSYRRDVSADALMERRSHVHSEQFGDNRNRVGKHSFLFDQYFVEGESLESHLLDQFATQAHSKLELKIGLYLIENLDENGYLHVPVFCIAAVLAVPGVAVQRVLAEIQHLDPVGVGARTLSECLIIQLEAKGRLTPFLQDLIVNHLSEFSSRAPAAIAREMGVSLECVLAALKDIRACDPKPGARFSAPVDPVWPEVVVDALGPGRYRVRLQDFYLPALKIDEGYRFLASSVTDKETGAYLKKKLEEAEGLVDGISYRHETLFKVASCVCARQADFFEGGYEHLAPLTMKEVAQAVGVSESTVSRLVNGNYVQTPRGVFELRFFFHSGAKDETGDAVSSVSVKHRIAELIRFEDPRHPLSDQALSDILSNQGVKVSRRTVNKYRTDMGILPCVARKRA